MGLFTNLISFGLGIYVGSLLWRQGETGPLIEMKDGDISFFGIKIIDTEPGKVNIGGVVNIDTN